MKVVLTFREAGSKTPCKWCTPVGIYNFKNEDFKYAVTIREDFTDWEYWAQRANWFFYRELYKNWHPVYANTYELYWERNEKENENIVSEMLDINIVDIDETTKKIVVSCGTDVDGMADVYIDYSVEKNDKLVYHKLSC